MRLYVCWGTFDLPTGHACARAHRALKEAGHDPEVRRAYGSAMLPELLNLTPGRRQVKRLTGNLEVPVLVTEEGEVVQGSREIADWAKANPAGAAARRRAGSA